VWGWYVNVPTDYASQLFLYLITVMVTVEGFEVI
jgi:hypothetical protein